ncbi:MAG: prolyl-tRNA synthetase associated domain-containing protein [Firmicutes bacterium]|uniref:Prolyl-tRNA synthetase associated domain-containing protein n=1 Tax=Candidatus Gallilactobacillus intestinavium TaxID=2840838 RepID=A0A9D9H9L7_9LACO|nr:prolyl-tRNA synthetase associated domain-containing protein [Candidatus Gallilactobacillus intestinavium]
MIIGTEQDYQNLLNTLIELHIDYKLVDHPAADSTEEADKYIEGYNGVRTKTLFLKDKYKNFYLVTTDDVKRFDFKKFQTLVNTKRISMANEGDVKLLGSYIGIISPLSLMNNTIENIKIYFDKEMLDENILTFHPNINTHTIFLKTEDVFSFIEKQGYTYSIVTL